MHVGERGKGVSAGVDPGHGAEGPAALGPLRLVLVSLNEDQQHGRVFFFSHIQLSKCRQGVGRKMDVNRARILASRYVKVSERPGSPACGQGCVYNDGPRSLN